MNANDFIVECRREWRRLRVPDPLANEMAADLAADLAEAEAEGASAEAVLGNEAFDPRSFAASWATAKGILGPPPVESERPPRQPRVLVWVAVSVVIALIGLGLLSARHGVSVQVQPAFRIGPSPLGVPQGSMTDSHTGFFTTIGALLLIAGGTGALLMLSHLSPWTFRLYRRDSPHSAD